MLYPINDQCNANFLIIFLLFFLVCDDHVFKDEFLFYKFRVDDGSLFVEPELEVYSRGVLLHQRCDFASWSIHFCMLRSNAQGLIAWFSKFNFLLKLNLEKLSWQPLELSMTWPTNWFLAVFKWHIFEVKWLLLLLFQHMC